MVLDTPAKNKIINKDVFRAYDIRGQIGKEWCLNDSFHDAYLIGQAIGKQLVNRQSPEILLGRDGRISSEQIAKNLTEGLLSVGCNVTDVGLTATPVVYFALSHLQIPNAVMVTGSHNPPDHNGIKIVYELSPLSGLVIETLYYDIIRQNFHSDLQGNYNKYLDIIPQYQQAIIENINLKKSLRVGIDSSNGATALFS